MLSSSHPQRNALKIQPFFVSNWAMPVPRLGLCLFDGQRTSILHIISSNPNCCHQPKPAGGTERMPVSWYTQHTWPDCIYQGRAHIEYRGLPQPIIGCNCVCIQSSHQFHCYPLGCQFETRCGRVLKGHTVCGIAGQECGFAHVAGLVVD